jgi:soluble lytic murein transglycosylase
MAAVLAGSGDHAAAVAAYESAIADQADAPTAWQLAVVQAHRAAGDHAAAIAAADRLVAGRSGDPLAPEAAWLRGLSQQAAGSYRAAADSFAALALTWPLADRAPEALWRRAAIVLDLDGSMAGADAFDDLANRYPGDDQALEARFRSAFLRLFAGYTSDAEARLSALAAEGDAAARARASFWLGRIAFDRGDPATAVERWREAASADAADFYGLRAAQRLGDEPAPTTDEPANPEADIAAWLATWRPGFDAADWQSAREEIAADRDVARSAAWLDLGERRAAVRTIDNAVQAHADDPVALAGLSLEARGLTLHGASIAAARRAQNAAPEHLRAAPPDALMRLVYPDAYGALVRDAASERGVPAALLFALIRSESRFEPSARSSAGALGLTQVMPATGQSIAGWLGEESFDPVDLYRPETAARFGAWFLGQQLESNDRQVPLALAAYNGGPGNAQRWWADAGGDIDAVAEVIDYSETRNYVRWVIEAQARYEQLYGDLGQ